MFRTLLLLLLVALSLTACRRTDIRTVHYAVEAPTVEERLRLIKAVKALDSQGGIQAEFKDGEIYVTYDSMRLAMKNIEYAIGLYPNGKARPNLP